MEHHLDSPSCYQQDRVAPSVASRVLGWWCSTGLGCRSFKLSPSVMPLEAGAISYLPAVDSQIFPFRAQCQVFSRSCSHGGFGEYQQAWLMPSLHTSRKGLHVSHKVCHLIESTGETP